MTRKTAKQYKNRADELDSRFSLWRPQLQLVSEYVHQRRADFTSEATAGAFINSQLWTDDPIHLAETSASAFLGYVWSAGEKSFKLTGNKRVFGKDETMQAFWAEVTEILQSEMGDREAGLSSVLDETTLDLITLGTDAVLVEERNIDMPEQGCLSFEGWSVLTFRLSEGAGGIPQSFYRRRKRKVSQVVEKYGIENVSKKVREKYEAGKLDEEIDILHVIEPRDISDRVKGSIASKDMPIRSIHIEVATNKFLLESGYPELPIACARLAKRNKEEYGRGRGMNALPSIMMLNQVWEDYYLALEKNLDPPMYLLNASVAGNGGIVDTSAGGITILRIDKSKTGNVAPTGKLFDIQEPRSALEVIDKLTQTIAKHFMIDRLIDLNNDVQMTKGEAFLRNEIRQATLRSIVSRVLAEKFDPIINISFAICLRRNKFGYIKGSPEAMAREAEGREVKYLPQAFLDAVADGVDLYEIEYKTPAARDMEAMEGQGTVETLALAGELAAFDPTVKHMIDSDWTLRRIAQIKGANRRMFKSKEEVDQAVADERKQIAQQQQLAAAQQAAGVAKDAASAQNMMQAQQAS